MNQRVKVGLHVLHEIWNFFYLFFPNNLCRIHFRNQIDTVTYRKSYDERYSYKDACIECDACINKDSVSHLEEVQNQIHNGES